MRRKYGLLWLRRDLRLADNPALNAICEQGLTPVPVYIHETRKQHWPLGGASAWWLHHSLHALRRDLRDRGSDLIVTSGDPFTELQRIGERLGNPIVCWNRRYEPDAIAHDQPLKQRLGDAGMQVTSFNADLLAEPAQLVKEDGTPYRVFTAFWNRLQKRLPHTELLPAPTDPGSLPRIAKGRIAALGLLPTIPWDQAFGEYWRPGEQGAWDTLEAFCADGADSYADDRDRPAIPGTSCLSPHLHFGEIGPHQVWQRLQQYAQQAGHHAQGEAFVRQIAWREFARHLLYHFPHTDLHPLDRRFETFPWRGAYAEELAQWQRGRTGIPLIDAGMRQLWGCGWMHNRVRMVAASFLTKNLLIPWQEGARWFWDTLVDADLANNSMGWQWVAGCGADAAPYFRVFNPVRQGERFDPDGSYVRTWVPELADMPAKWIHQPWQAPANVMATAGIRLGQDYPLPMVDLSASRTRSLGAWDEVRHRR